MPDNYSQDIRPEWEDEGWAKMQALLDQHLPSPAQPKPAAAWRALGAGLLVLLMAYLFWPASPPAIGYFPIAMPAAQSTAELAVPPSKTQADQNPLQAAASTPNPAPQSRQTELPSQQRPNLLPPAALPTVASQADASAIHSPQDKNLPTAAEQAREQPSETNAQPAWTLASIPTASDLPRLAYPAPALPERPQPQAKRPRRVQLGLMAGAFFHDYQLPSGGHIGLFADYRPFSSPWYAVASLQLQSFHQNWQESERSLFFSNTALARNNAANGGNSLLSVTNTLSQANYLALQTEIGHQITPRIALEVGGQAARLLSSQQSSDWALTPLDPSAPEPTDNAEKLPAEWSTIRPADRSGSNIPQWAFCINAGLSYRLSPTTRLRAQVQSSLTPVFEQSPQPARNHGVSVSVFQMLW